MGGDVALDVCTIVAQVVGLVLMFTWAATGAETRARWSQSCCCWRRSAATEPLGGGDRASQPLLRGRGQHQPPVETAIDIAPAGPGPEPKPLWRTASGRLVVAVSAQALPGGAPTTA